MPTPHYWQNTSKMLYASSLKDYKGKGAELSNWQRFPRDSFFRKCNCDSSKWSIKRNKFLITVSLGNIIRGNLTTIYTTLKPSYILKKLLFLRQTEWKFLIVQYFWLLRYNFQEQRSTHDLINATTEFIFE